MRGSQAAYRAIETVLGRDLAWRLGRFLYLGARRELLNDPNSNGEYALIEWLFDAVAGCKGPFKAHDSSRTLHLIDVGANVGEWTCRVFIDLDKRGLGNAASIHAFEPAPAQNAEFQSRLAADIARDRAHLHCQALAEKPATSRFTVTGAQGGTSALSNGVSESGVEIDVQVSTLDEVASRFSMDEILLVKIDTEGNDFNVLCGGAQLLQTGRVLVAQFEYNWRWVGFGHWLRSVFHLIKNCPYAFARLTRDGMEVHDDWHPELEHYYETNYVLVRRDVLPVLPHTQVIFGNSGTVSPR